MESAPPAARAGLDPFNSNVDAARAALPVISSRRSKECREFGIAQVVIRESRRRGLPLRGGGHKALGADMICIFFNVIIRAECSEFIHAL